MDDGRIGIRRRADVLATAAEEELMTPDRTVGGSGRDEAPVRRSPWLTIIVIYLTGVVAAMSYGKFSAVGPSMADELGLSLSQLGWAISAVVGVGAVAGLPAGYLVRRFGAGRSLIAALALMVAASALSTAAGSFGWLLAARVAEGVGYLVVTVACPALVLHLAEERDRGLALSIWATFVPVGIGVSTLVGGVAGEALGWRGWVLLIAGLTVLMTVAVRTRLPRTSASEAAAGPVPGARALAWPALLTASFCLMVLVTMPVVVLLPTLLIDEHASSAGAAGALTSAISFVGVLGGLSVGVLLRRGVPLAVLALSGLLVVPAAWLAYGADAPLAAAATGAGIVSLENGLLGAFAFAALPLVLERLDHADVGTGMVAQMGSVGALVGPPLFGLVAGASGFGAVVPVVAAGMLASVGGMLLVTRHVARRGRGLATKGCTKG
ncbi:MFS transporter [Microbispora hainanensis]|uniref:MFS transporter n=1 Tax=Microbispora TaxID=2005 RepID=UPI00115983DD|nr:MULTISPECIES: MFS transporter [Microbispora]NJP23473.1 MFS transporter [Microbispora sp. CL1-1]TQS15710.1 MFS transporter [Microbispora sp. SCL1-1]